LAKIGTGTEPLKAGCYCKQSPGSTGFDPIFSAAPILLTHPGMLFPGCGPVLRSHDRVASHFYESLFSYILTGKRVQAKADASDLIVIFAPSFLNIVFLVNEKRSIYYFAHQRVDL
jgi:hypothetical protein